MKNKIIQTTQLFTIATLLTISVQVFLNIYVLEKGATLNFTNMFVALATVLVAGVLCFGIKMPKAFGFNSEDGRIFLAILLLLVNIFLLVVAVYMVNLPGYKIQWFISKYGIELIIASFALNVVILKLKFGIFALGLTTFVLYVLGGDPAALIGLGLQGLIIGQMIRFICFHKWTEVFAKKQNNVL
jgi:hypothetical protein